MLGQTTKFAPTEHNLTTVWLDLQDFCYIDKYAQSEISNCGEGTVSVFGPKREKNEKKLWHKPQLNEQEVGLEVTSYQNSKIDKV